MKIRQLNAEQITMKLTFNAMLTNAKQKQNKCRLVYKLNQDQDEGNTALDEGWLSERCRLVARGR